MVSHHPGKFCGHRHCSSGDINIPANTVILPQMWDVAAVMIYTRLLPPLSPLKYGI